MTCTCFFALFALLSTAKAMIIHHNFDAPTNPYGTCVMLERVAMYAANEAPSKSAPGKGQSYIKFDLQMQRTQTDNASVRELMVIPDTNMKDIGLIQNGKLHICCTEELIGTACEEENRNTVIVNKDIKGIYRYAVPFDQGMAETRISVTHEVQVTGIHVFALGSCGLTLGPVTFSGKSVWMNPYGHLPGDVYGYLPFYRWMCVLYLVTAAIWCCVNSMYRRALSRLHHCITVVVFISLIEMSVWYLYYTHVNTVGSKSDWSSVRVLAIGTSVTKRILLSLLFFAVAIGYGLFEKSSVQNPKKKLLQFAIAQSLLALFNCYVEFESRHGWKNTRVFVCAMVWTTCLWGAIFAALYRSMKMLRSAHDMKLRYYQCFALLLAAVCIVATAHEIYLKYVLENLNWRENLKWRADHWQQWWLYDAGSYQIWSSISLFAVLFMCKPSQCNKVVNGKRATEMEDMQDVGVKDMGVCLLDPKKRKTCEHTEVAGMEAATLTFVEMSSVESVPLKRRAKTDDTQ